MNPVCCGCCREMQCERNGVVVKCCEDHYYSGDKFHCKECNRSVIVGFGRSYTKEGLSVRHQLDNSLDQETEMVKLVQ